MALVGNLVQLGIQPEAAKRIGFTPAAVTAAGTTATDATVLGKDGTLVLVTVGASTPGVKLPATAELGVPYVLGNISANAGVVYPPASGQINGDTATSGGVPLTARGTTVCIRVDNINWVAIGGAAG